MFPTRDLQASATHPLACAGRGIRPRWFENVILDGDFSILCSALTLAKHPAIRPFCLKLRIRVY